MLEVSVRLILGGLLAGAAAAKLASPSSSRAALGTFGVEDRRAQLVAWTALIGAELALAAGVIAGVELAAWGAAALVTMFAATMVGAIARGRAGAPCACFGARSTVGWGSVARNLALAGAFAGLTFLPRGELSTDEWLALGLAVALLACLGLGIAVLALAREVGMLRLRLGGASALEIADEGPALGSRTAVIDHFALDERAELALAVFSSEGCPVCRSIEPSVRVLDRDPEIAVEVFDEARDAGIWGQLDVPGSPYAIALDRSGTVLAKGTFNNLAQLESVLATGDRRRAGEGREAVGA